ncbi:MAG: AbrB family transcriptional regulator [Clostridia bacterium]|nr:AbrB family transcriptional regulator [Clostridia bacterium]
MKFTGIIKSVDQLGRFKIPRECLESHNIDTNTPLKIFRRGKTIIIQKEMHNCIFCSSIENILTFKDKYICKNCIKKIKDKLVSI